MRSFRILRGEGLALSACSTLQIVDSSAPTRILLGDRSRLNLVQNHLQVKLQRHTCMYHSRLMHEIQSSHNHEQEPLEESFLECSLVEKVS